VHTAGVAESARYRFRPKQPGVALAACVLGAGLAVSGVVDERWSWAVLGAVAAVLGFLYLVSPAWRTEVVIDGEALEVLSRGDRRFRLPWSEVKRVVVARASATAFVDGGAPDRSLLLPGRGARAPYRIENQPDLLAHILSRVAADRVVEVDRLDRFRP
jgi:hypothetical protein